MSEANDHHRLAFAKVCEEIATYAARAYAAEGRAKAAEERAAGIEESIEDERAEAAHAMADARERERDALREAATWKGKWEAANERADQRVADVDEAEAERAKADERVDGLMNGLAAAKADRLQALRDLEAMRAERDAALGTVGTLKAEIRVLTEKAAP